MKMKMKMKMKMIEDILTFFISLDGTICSDSL